MTTRNGHDTAQHVLDLITGEVERAKKLEAELRKLLMETSRRAA